MDNSYKMRQRFIISEIKITFPDKADDDGSGCDNDWG